MHKRKPDEMSTTNPNEDENQSSSSSEEEESTDFNRSAITTTHLRLVTRADDNNDNAVSFSPLYAHQLFPDARIVGYKDPAIVIAFAHDSLFAHASVTFADRTAEPPHTNIARRLRDYSPKSSPIEFDRAAFVARAFTPDNGGRAEPFVPPGTRLLSYRNGVDDSDEFEVYSGLLDDASMRAYVERASLFLPFFIERASYVKPESNWLALLLFQRRSADVVSFVGMLTVYRWAMPLTARERWRISQVLVLPPFQRRGHGACLLRAAYHAASAWSTAKVDDITVEEPSPEFTQMRDSVDLEMLIEAGVLPMSETLEVQPTRWRAPGEPRTLVDGEAVRATCAAVRERFRLCDVQTRRLIRAARYLNGDANRAPESGGEPDVANPRTLSLRERWCAARHWRVYGEPLARMQQRQASASILRAYESEAASGVERVIAEWGMEAEAFEKLRTSFNRAMKLKNK